MGWPPDYARAMTDLPVVQPGMELSAPLLEYLARRMRSEMESEMARFEVRPRHLIALTIIRRLGGPSQADLATALDVDRTNLVGLLNDLETEGFLERRRDPADRRRHTVHLTDDGGRRLATIEKALAGVEEQVLSALDHDERVTLHTLLSKAASANAAGACAPPE
jgi:MarR family transcriptional regulator, lower aerobic nicotinate degradation pathway regulator